MKEFPSALLVILLSAVSLAAQEQEDAAAVTASPSPSPEATPAASENAVAPEITLAEDTASLQSKVGSEVLVEGVVKNVGKGPNDGITFLNFGDRKAGFVAVIFRPAYDKFPEGFEKYGNQKVRVRGMLENFRDRQLQVKIFTPDQLEVVADAP